MRLQVLVTLLTTETAQRWSQDQIYKLRQTEPIRTQSLLLLPDFVDQVLTMFSQVSLSFIHLRNWDQLLVLITAAKTPVTQTLLIRTSLHKPVIIKWCLFTLEDPEPVYTKLLTQLLNSYLCKESRPFMSCYSKDAVHGNWTCFKFMKMFWSYLPGRLSNCSFGLTL